MEFQLSSLDPFPDRFHGFREILAMIIWRKLGSSIHHPSLASAFVPGAHAPRLDMC